MKMKPEHYRHMANAIKVLITDRPKDIADHIKAVVKSGNYKNLKKRVRWDMHHESNLLRFTCDILYKYLHDDHIDTALRSIMGEYNFYNEL